MLINDILVICLALLLFGIMIVGIVSGIREILEWLKRRRMAKIGKRGEKEVYKVLKKGLGRKYRILRDVYLGSEKKSTQIDLLVVSRYGIFVIEVKNWTGKIYGTEESLNWQVYNKGYRNEYYNPIRQNNGHLNSLRKVFGGDLVYTPIVVFTEKADITNLKGEVISIDRLVKYIKSFKKKVMSRRERNEVYRKIKKENKRSLKKSHIKYVEKIKKRP